MGIPLEDACMMASKNPAETAGVYHKTGSLTPGKLADILILNDKLAIKHVILRGTLIF
ncbi:MAG: amidohydrolase family protein [Eubacteriales bacterium]